MRYGPIGLLTGLLLGCPHTELCFGKACHLPLELEYKAMWAIKKLNFDCKASKEKRLLQLNDWKS